MSLLDSILGAVGNNSGNNTSPNPLPGMLGDLLTRSGGLEGLMNRFSQAGLGQEFSSWVGTGPNTAVNPAQIQHAVGSDQLRGIATQLGIDPNQAADLLAQFLPGVIDKLTPQGSIDPNLNVPQAVGNLLPALLKAFTSGGSVR